MSTSYPSGLDNFTNPSGTQTLESPDHAAQHANVNDAVEAIQTTLGTTAGTSVLKNFSAGQFAARTNSETFGTPTLTLGSDATGDIYYRSSGGTVTRLAIGTANQVISTNGTIPTWADNSNDDWKIATGTWTYSSWDSNYKIGSITVDSDATTIYSAGMRIRISQSTGGTKYGVIVKVETTTLTVYFGTDYTLNSEAISSPYYATVKSPFAFPVDPNKWTQEAVFASGAGTSDLGMTNGTTWGNNVGISIYIPIGSWDVYYSGLAHIDMDASSAIAQAWTTLGTATNAESDADFTSSANYLLVTGMSSGDQQNKQMHSKRKTLTLTANTRYYWNNKTTAGSFGATNLKGTEAKTVLRATCLLI